MDNCIGIMHALYFHAVRYSAKDFEQRANLTVESASGEKNT
jgi:hypothetical protein